MFKLGLSGRKKVAARPAAAEEAGQAALTGPAQAPGLTPAGELPSATAALAELFPEEERGTPGALAEETQPESSGRDEGDALEVAELPAAAAKAAELAPQEQRSAEPEPVPATARNATDARAEDSEPVTTPAAPPGQAPTLADLFRQAAPFSAPTVAQSAREPVAANKDAEVASGDAAAAAVPPKPAARPAAPAQAASDWAFEEKLASHREWVESQGATGNQADLSAAKLEGAELIGVNLRFADLHDANLKSADLLLADLRDACLARANLEEACLVGTNLEGANLEGARLESAMGLVPRQLAGANLHLATLPQQIREFEAVAEFQRASWSAAALLAVVLSVSFLSWLMIWKTKDVQLLANAAVLPFLHSARAAAAMPVVQFYCVLPVVLLLLYLLFQFHLQRLWDAALELPAIFPDGRGLGERLAKRGQGRGSRIILALLRAQLRWLDQDAPSTRAIEKGLAILAAYWLVPVTLLLFWARYLTLKDPHGTILHVLLVTVATGTALYSTLRVGRPKEGWAPRKNLWRRIADECKKTNPASWALGFGAILALLSLGTIAGAPHDTTRAPQFGATNIRRWAPDVLWTFGIDPFADLTEAQISFKPANWNGADDQLGYVHGAHLDYARIRYAQAYAVFLAEAHLWRADFQGSFMPEADLRGADLGEASLRYATLDRARLYRANLDRAHLDGANLARADLRETNMSYDSLLDAILTDARLDGATLYGADLENSTAIRASLQRADLREARLDNANLEHADLQQAYLWSGKLPGAHLNNAQLGSALLIDADLSNADLRWAQFPGTVLTGANLSGARLDGADLTGAFGLAAHQVCSAASHAGAQLSDALRPQVEAECGTPQ